MENARLRLRLPALRRANIVACWTTNTTRGTLRCDEVSFLETVQLKSLRLHGHGTVTLMPNCLEGLTALAMLKLESCGLANIPTAVLALAGSLTLLALPFNADLQLASSDVTTLLALRKLRKLDLRKTFVGSDLNGSLSEVVIAHLRNHPVWSEDSLQHLLDLRNAFNGRHGHALAVQVRDSEGED